METYVGDSYAESSKRRRLNKEVENDLITKVENDSQDHELTVNDSMLFEISNLSNPNEVDPPRKESLITLPTDILQIILSSLPILDLLSIVSRTCSTLHKVIFDDSFLRWKKLYHKYLRSEKCPCANAEISLLMKDIDGFSDPSQNLVATLLYINGNFGNKRGDEHERLFVRLNQHDSTLMASDFVDRQLWPRVKQRPSVWVYLCTMLLLSESPLTAVVLLRKVVRSPSLLPQQQLIECVHLFGLFLLVAQRRLSVDRQSVRDFRRFPINDVYFQMFFSSRPIELKLSPRWHYKIASALSLFENGGGKCRDTGTTIDFPFSSIHSSGPPKNLTFEQYRIVHNDLLPNDCVRIIAFAGTGKTTTIKEYVRARPNQHFLVLMFNRNVCDEAKVSFPSNATCRTTHSLAIGHAISLADGTSTILCDLYSGQYTKLKIGSIVKMLEKGQKGNLFKRAKYALYALENFICSADLDISRKHLPTKDFDPKNNAHSRLDMDVKNVCLSDACKVWRQMCDPRNTQMPITYDGCLKLFQLSNPIVIRNNGRPYDAILVDEAQDMNPAILDVIRKQTQSPKIFVGDPHQQIYSFRGAINAFNRIKQVTSKTFYLTQSFRFGPEIAFLAQCYLKTAKNEHNKLLLGSEKPSRIDGLKHGSGPICVICRLNATIFDYCVQIATLMSSDVKVHVVGDLEKFNLDDLLEIHTRLVTPGCSRKKIWNRPCTWFSDISSLLDYAQRNLDADLEAQITMVKKHVAQLPIYVDLIRKRLTTNPKDAAFILSTVHKAKGMEYDTVWLASDFFTLDDHFQRNRPRPPEDEFNLLYVAMTRAKHCLVMNR